MQIVAALVVLVAPLAGAQGLEAPDVAADLATEATNAVTEAELIIQGLQEGMPLQPDARANQDVAIFSLSPQATLDFLKEARPMPIPSDVVLADALLSVDLFADVPYDRQALGEGDAAGAVEPAGQAADDPAGYAVERGVARATEFGQALIDEGLEGLRGMIGMMDIAIIVDQKPNTVVTLHIEPPAGLKDDFEALDALARQFGGELPLRFSGSAPAVVEFQRLLYIPGATYEVLFHDRTIQVFPTRSPSSVERDRGEPQDPVDPVDPAGGCRDAAELGVETPDLGIDYDPGPLGLALEALSAKPLRSLAEYCGVVPPVGGRLEMRMSSDDCEQYSMIWPYLKTYAYAHLSEDVPGVLTIDTARDQDAVIDSGFTGVELGFDTLDCNSVVKNGVQASSLEMGVFGVHQAAVGIPQDGRAPGTNQYGWTLNDGQATTAEVSIDGDSRGWSVYVPGGYDQWGNRWPDYPAAYYYARATGIEIFYPGMSKGSLSYEKVIGDYQGSSSCRRQAAWDAVVPGWSDAVGHAANLAAKSDRAPDWFKKSVRAAGWVGTFLTAYGYFKDYRACNPSKIVETTERHGWGAEGHGWWITHTGFGAKASATVVTESEYAWLDYERNGGNGGVYARINVPFEVSSYRCWQVDRWGSMNCGGGYGSSLTLRVLLYGKFQYV